MLAPADGELRAAVTARLSIALTEMASETERTALADEAVAMAHRLGDPAVRALAAYCDAISGPGHVAARLEAAIKLRSLADAAGDQIGRLLARRLVVVALAERGELAAADAEGLAYARIADQLVVAQYRWLPLVWLARRACLAGDLGSARRHADEAARVGAQAGSVNARYMVTSVWLAIFRVEGTLGDHRDEITDGYAGILDLPNSFGPMAEVAIAAGDLIEGRRLLAAALAIGIDAMAHDSEWLTGAYCLGASAISLGDAEAARDIYRALTPYAGVFAIDGLAAAVIGVTDQMLGRLAAFLGDRPAAAHHLRDALAAHRRAGSPVLVAASEAELTRIGATETPPAPRSRPPTAAGAAEDDEGEFRRAGRLWQVRYRGESAIVPDSKGMGDLATLLAAAGRDVHVLDLVDSTGTARATATSAGDMLDSTARQAYRRRLTELEKDLGEAEANGDLGRIDQVMAERDFLLAELAGALGLGGRSRSAADPVERARKAVSMRIGTALRAIEAVHGPLARHLRLAVTTGRLCAYRPEQPVRWHTHR